MVTDIRVAEADSSTTIDPAAAPRKRRILAHTADIIVPGHANYFLSGRPSRRNSVSSQLRLDPTPQRRNSATARTPS